MLLLDVTPLSLGIETLGGVMTKLIEKNTTIPTRKSEVFSTAEDNQPAVSIHVLQGEREMAGDNKTLGRFELTGIAPAQRGLPRIEVVFDIDANGIVNVSAKDEATGKARSIRITASSGLSKTEIEALVREAELHADEDKKKKEKVTIRNEADALVYRAEKMIKESGAGMEPDSIHKAEGLISDLKQAVNQDDPSRMKKLTGELTKALHVLSGAMYGKTDSTGGSGQTGSRKGQDSPGAKPADDDIVDAEFSEVA